VGGGSRGGDSSDLEEVKGFGEEADNNEDAYPVIPKRFLANPGGRIGSKTSARFEPIDVFSKIELSANFKSKYRGADQKDEINPHISSLRERGHWESDEW
jgi:hypothetical protein